MLARLSRLPVLSDSDPERPKRIAKGMCYVHIFGSRSQTAASSSINLQYKYIDLDYIYIYWWSNIIQLRIFLTARLNALYPYSRDYLATAVVNCR